MGRYLAIALLLIIALWMLRSPFRKQKRVRKHNPLLCALDLLARQYARTRNTNFDIQIKTKRQKQYFEELVQNNLVEGDTTHIDITLKGQKLILPSSNIYLSIDKWTKTVSKSSVILAIYYFVLTAVIISLPGTILADSFLMGKWYLIAECILGLVTAIIAGMSAKACMRIYAMNNSDTRQDYLISLKIAESKISGK